MTRAAYMVGRLLEDDSLDFDPDSYVDKFADEVDADKARGVVNYNTAQTCSRFYHRTERYKSRGRQQGGPYEARRNGATKTWKTRPGEFRIPIKIGFKSYGYIDNSNADQWATRPDFKEAWEMYAEKTRKAKQASEIARLQATPIGPNPQETLPIDTKDPRQPELFNEHSRLRELGLY